MSKYIGFYEKQLTVVLNFMFIMHQGCIALNLIANVYFMLQLTISVAADTSSELSLFLLHLDCYQVRQI